MKKFEITEERIKLLADNNSWSESKLKEWYPNAFTLEVGKWYKNTINKNESLVCYITEFKNDIFNYYGFDVVGDWQNNDFYSIKDCGVKLRLATPQEVQTALINEAKKKYEGKNVDCVHFPKNTIAFNDILSFSFDLDNCLRVKTQNALICLFDNGQWATIIEQKEYTMQEIADALKVNVKDLKIKK